MAVKGREWWANQKVWQRIQRTITKDQIPDLWDSMKADGVWIKLTATGYQLYVGAYTITKKSLADAWNLNDNAVGRIINYAFNNSDFGISTGWEEP